MEQELAGLQAAKHRRCRHVVRLLDMAFISGYNSMFQPALLLERGSKTLYSFIREDIPADQLPDEGLVRQLLFQMILGVGELHAVDIWHRDISPHNAMLFAAPASTMGTVGGSLVKLIDLGACRFLEQVKTGKSVTHIFTPGYVAPEYASHGAPSNKREWMLADVYSMGTVGVFLALKQHPRNRWADLRQHDGFRSWSAQGLAVLTACMQEDPKQRPTTQQLLSDPWFEADRAAVTAAAAAGDDVGVFVQELLDGRWKE